MKESWSKARKVDEKVLFKSAQPYVAKPFTLSKHVWSIVLLQQSRVYQNLLVLRIWICCVIER